MAPSCEHPWRRAFWMGEVDARPVALLRIALGVLLLVDLGDRLRDFHAFYTTPGIVVPAGRLLGFPGLSLFHLSDDPRFTLALYLAGMAVAVCLALGWATRAVAVAAWVFVVSLHHRNPFVCNGGDSVLRLLLFWGMFTDWGGRWSLDVLLKNRQPASAVFAFPVRLIQLQIAVIYLVTAAAKTGATWRDGSAVGRVLVTGDWGRGLAGILGAHPALCVALTYGVLVIEWALPLALVAPWRPDRVRAAALVAGLVLHLGIFATLRVGMFSTIMPASYAIFVRPRWLDEVSRWCATRPKLQWWAETLGSHRPAPGVMPPSSIVQRGRSTLALILGAVVLLVVADRAWAAVGVVRPTRLREVVAALGQDQRWQMFAPDVPRQAISWTAPALLADGARIDLTADLLPGLRSHHGFVYSRWHKLRESLALQRPPLSRAMGRYACRLAAAAWPSPVVRFDLVQHRVPLDPPGPEQTTVLLTQSCIGDLAAPVTLRSGAGPQTGDGPGAPSAGGPERPSR